MFAIVIVVGRLRSGSGKRCFVVSNGSHSRIENEMPVVTQLQMDGILIMSTHCEIKHFEIVVSGRSCGIAASW